jgi:hypothetical protein
MPGDQFLAGEEKGYFLLTIASYGAYSAFFPKRYQGLFSGSKVARA